MTDPKSFVFKFEDIEVRESEFALTRAGETVKVEPTAFRVLLYLLRNPGRLVTKEEIMAAVWPNTTVSDNSLTRSVATVRRVLDDSSREPRFIATVQTLGYRFLASVEKFPADGKLESPAATTEKAEHVGKGNQTEPVRHVAEITPAPPNLAETEADSAGGHKSGSTQMRGALLWFSLVAMLLVALLVLSATRHRATAGRAPVASRIHIVPLTSLPGIARTPALSPDGERVAFFWNNETPAKWNLYVQMVGGEKPLQLTSAATRFTCCTAWSPNGREIAFGQCDDDGGGVFVVPALGGTVRKLTDVVCTYGEAGFAHWTADGKSLLLADRCSPGAPRGIVLFSLSTGEKRCLHAPEQGDFGDREPVLSPDQRTVAFLRQKSLDIPDIYTVSLSGGDLRQLQMTDAGHCCGLMWSADGRRIIFRDANGLSNIPAGGGPIERELQYPAFGSLSRDGRRMAFEELWGFSQGSSTVWKAELSNPGGPVVSQTRIIAFPGGNSATQLSPDGRRITWQGNRSGNAQIWKSDADGNNSIQLTFFEEGYTGTPRWSPDGNWIAFDYHSGVHAQIYLIDSQGRNQHPITSGNFENVVPSWSRDGRSVYFSSNRTGSWQVWRHELSTGRESQITQHGGFAAFESYDSKTLYYSQLEGGGLWSVPRDGGQDQHLTPAPHYLDWGHFAVTEAGIYVIDSTTEPGPTILYYSFSSRQLKPVLMLKQSADDGTANLAASRDGRTVIYGQVDGKASIMMADNLQ